MLDQNGKNLSQEKRARIPERASESRNLSNWGWLGLKACTFADGVGWLSEANNSRCWVERSVRIRIFPF